MGGTDSANRTDRRLLVSVFGPQEAREAVLGGARIIDSEDPRSALGTIKPRRIMDIADAVLAVHRPLPVQLSTNIGEDQLLFRRAPNGLAIAKSGYEQLGKSAQAALGVAAAMGTRVHPAGGIVKVGVDGMRAEQAAEVIAEVVATLRRAGDLSHTRVMAVLFAQDLELWAARRALPQVRRALVGLGEYHPCAPGTPGAFDLADFAGALLDEDGSPAFGSYRPDAAELVAAGALPPGSTDTLVAVTEPFAHADHGLTPGPRTDRRAIAAMVEAAAAAGADSIMLDTSILLKVARIGLISTAGSTELVDLDRHDRDAHGLVRSGILGLDEIRFFVELCHAHDLEANLAGSVQSHQAQQVWRLVPEVDQLSARGGVVAPARDPHTGRAGRGTRHDRVVRRTLVSGLVPPEQGGRLVLPARMADSPGLREDLDTLLKLHPDLTAYQAGAYGELTPWE
ncbi:(5-formylfuran-3-yl)methyl phosphate synthase [Kitasatospora viridis]|uniref:(5-formylfuran-3-yl)methyl phosphate synthase n=1 Tax=Kitasatospora viridis TaxID=281105 RepID=A0A561T752_9ACTN|nr:(5-formylfuran-3-yl)methyl phosphate synthase [Kitasatospora viridis]TWF82941.1 putative methanogenic enzyme for methanofuran synthesis [Kitasatospora viridis]